MSSNNNNNKRTKSMFSKVVNYFCICKKNTRPQQKQSLQPSILNPFSIQPSPNENKENEIINNVFSNNQNINIEKPPLKMTKVKIRTKYMATPIEHKDYKPEKQIEKQFPYCCPICFRYFSRIFKSTCCQNYCCYLCIRDINQYINKMDTQKLFIQCNFCTSENFYFLDVEKTDPIKIYTDSPFNNRISSKKPSNQKLQTSEKQEESLSKFHVLKKKLGEDFSKIDLVSKNINDNTKDQSKILKNQSQEDDECDSYMHRSPSPIGKNSEKIMKLRGIGNKDKNTFSEEKNKESNNNKDQALVASRNYLLNGKTLFFR